MEPARPLIGILPIGVPVVGVVTDHRVVAVGDNTNHRQSSSFSYLHMQTS